jgi:hypothetical protein
MTNAKVEQSTESHTLTCAWCEEMFTPAVMRVNRKYCSTVCKSSMEATHIRSAGGHSATCLNCGVTFSFGSSRPRKFCSRRCSAATNNRGVTRNPRVHATRTRCLRCQVPLTSGQRRFCSRACWGTFGKDQRAAAWLAGDDLGSTAKGELKSWVRLWMIEDSGNACSLCGWSVPNPVINRPILAIDHIDGNWQNNTRDNLRVLCYNCHTLTPTFGSLNRGNTSGQRPNVVLSNLKRAAGL